MSTHSPSKMPIRSAGRRCNAGRAHALAALATILVAAGALGARGASALLVYGSPRAMPGAGGCLRDPLEEPTLGQVCPGGAVGLVGAQAVAVSPDGANVYVAGEGGVVALARNRSTGALAPAWHPSRLACIGAGSGGQCASSDDALGGADAVAVSHNGRFVYVGGADSATVSAFSRGPHGLLEPLGRAVRHTKKSGSFYGCVSGAALGGTPKPSCGAQAPPLNGVDALAISPDGRYLYAVSYGLSPGGDSVVILRRDPGTGGLQPVSEPRGCVQSDPGTRECQDVSDLEGASAIVISPDGRFAYVASQVSGAVRAFSRNRTTGALKPLEGGGGCVDSGKHADGDTPCPVADLPLSGARSLALSPDGHELYAAAFDPGAVVVLQRDPRTGRVAPGISNCLQALAEPACPGGVPELRGASGLALSPNGLTVYVATESGNSLLELVRDPVGGTLSLANVQPTALDPLSGPVALALSPDGRDIYVASPLDGVAGLGP